MDFKDLQSRLRDFAAARDWKQFHTPKNLAMALMVEAAELLELFQWLTTEQSHTLTRDAVDMERVGDEVADVLLYLVQLADRTGVDVEQAVERKLLKNAQRYPAKHPEKPEPGPKIHVFVDWENVQPKGTELRLLVPEGSDVWLFHSPQQKVDSSSHQLTFGAGKVTLVPRTGAGKNALDFQLSYYIGYVSARQPQGRFVVVSNDGGYDPMLAHARELGFDAVRREFHRAPAPPPVLSAKPKSVKAAAIKAKPPSVALASRPDAEPSAAQIAWRAIVQLRVREFVSRPVRSEEWQTFVEGLIREPVRDKAGLAQRACQLVWGRRLGQRAAPDDLLHTAQLRPEAPAVLEYENLCVGSATLSPQGTMKNPVAASKSVQPLAATKKPPPVPRMDSKDSAQSGRREPAGKKVVVAATAAGIAQHVLISLGKMPGNKPARRAGLLKFIETHASKATNPKSMALQVCALLEARNALTLSPDGKSITYTSARAKKPARI